MTRTSGQPLSRPAASDPVSRQPRWPVRAGRVPPTTGSLARADIAEALAPDPAVLFIPASGGTGRVQGWPTGKTRLAAYLAESSWRSGELDLLAWVTASSRASVLTGYAEAAEALGLNCGGDAGELADRFLAWLAATDQRWLLVLDDIRDAGDVTGLWPRGAAGRVLATAPGPEAVPGEADVRLAEVPVFSIREAISFLAGELTADPDQRAGVLDLAEALDGEPAAVAQAAAVIADSDLTCRDYRELVAGHQEDAGIELPAPEVTWRLSAEHAGLAGGPGTWPLLVLISVLDCHGIPATVAETTAVAEYVGVPQADQVRALVLALHQAGLVGIDTAGDPPLVMICGAVQAAVRAGADSGLLDAAARAAADALAGAWPEKTQPHVLTDRFRACAAALREVAGTVLWGPGGCHPVMWLAGQSLDAAGMPGPAAGWWWQLTAGSRQFCGTDHPDTRAAAGKLAGALLAAGQADDAVWWAGQVLDDRSRLDGPDHPVTIAARTLLGRALAAAGQPGEAVAVLAGALASSERVHGLNDPVTLEVLEAHAAACLAAGLTAEAVTGCRRLLEARRWRCGPAHPSVIAAGLALTTACLQAGRPDDAARVCERLLDAVKHAHGTSLPDILPVTEALAAAMTAGGRITEALRLREDSCAASERILGPGSPDTLRHRAVLARAYWDAGQASDAVTLLTDTIRHGDRVLPPGDPCTGELRQELAAMTGGSPA